MKNSLRWCFWFFIGNCLLLWLIGLNYVSTIPWIHSSYLIPKWHYELRFFVVISFIGQLALLSLLPAIILLPFFAYCKRFRLLAWIAMIVATLIAGALLVDTIIYQLYRFHLNGVVMQLVLHGLDKQFFDISQTEFIFIPLVIIAIFLLEGLYAVWLWRKIILAQRWIGVEKWTLMGLGLCLYTSLCMVVLSEGELFHRVLVETTRFLPLYPKISVARIGESYLEHAVGNQTPLHYPLQPLQFQFPQKPYNVLVILVDTWRYDMLNKAVTPSLDQFAKHAWVFSNHMSGGNSTGPGVFSLLYGLPSSYWGAMETQHRGPVLLDALLKAHYQLKVFFSGSLKLPAFDKTVFAALKILPPEPTGTPYERDQTVTKQWIDFASRDHSQPFFAYIHLESAHGFCALKNDFSPFKPAIQSCNRAALNNQTDPIPYLNRYKNALYLDDQLAGKIIATLQQYHLLKNTVVIVTGDHGEEFNDNHQGYWSHASNFTKYQVQTPLILYWPGEKPHVFHYQTTHYDVVPTLMTKLLGLKNPVSDYGIGKNLLDHSERASILLGGYIDYGLLEKDRITRIYSTGDYDIEQLDSRPLSDASLRMKPMQAAFQVMRRFYR